MLIFFYLRENVIFDIENNICFFTDQLNLLRDTKLRLTQNWSFGKPK